MKTTDSGGTVQSSVWKVNTIPACDVRDTIPIFIIIIIYVRSLTYSLWAR